MQPHILPEIGQSLISYREYLETQADALEGELLKDLSDPEALDTLQIKAAYYVQLRRLIEATGSKILNQVLSGQPATVDNVFLSQIKEYLFL